MENNLIAGLEYSGKPECVGYTKLTYSKFVWGQNLNYNFRFGSFNRPDDLEKDYLHICLDHSWQPHEDDNVIFIDHHLIENKFNNIYRSNADLMYENFEHIYTFFLNMFRYTSNSNFNIIVHIHNDVDGLASGIIFKYILDQIHNSENVEVPNIQQLRTGISFAHILGNYGDLDPEAKKDLKSYFKVSTEMTIFDKKIKELVKCIGRFFKSIRNYDLTDKNCHLNTLLVKHNSSVYEVNDLLNFILEFLSNSKKKIDNKYVIYLLNIFAQNPTLKLVIELFDIEVNRIIQNYIQSSTPQIEMTIIFKQDGEKIKYKLLIIETPFDCGRSVIWKYRAELGKAMRTQGTSSPWKFNITNYKTKKLDQIAECICCYNALTGKLSLDSNIPDSAYDIAVNIFNGGGHKATSDNRSLGSALIESEKELFDKISIIEIF